jgi:hypothetical protein
MQIITFTIPNWLAITTLLNRLEIEYPEHKQSSFDLEVVPGGFLADFIKGHTFEYEGETKTDDVVEIYNLLCELEERKPRINEVDERSYDCFMDYLNKWDALNIEGLELKWWTSEWPEGEAFEQPWVMTMSVATTTVEENGVQVEKQILIENGDWISPQIALGKTVLENPFFKSKSTNNNSDKE